MKKMMKLFHNSELIGNIEFLGLNYPDMLGKITLTPEGEKFKEFFAFFCDEEREENQEPPFPASLIIEGWEVEDHEGILRKINGKPAILDNFTTIYWRWA